MADVRKETMSGVKWQFLQKLTLQPLQFLYSIVLARLISPEEMGVLGLTAIFFAIAALLQQCGFGTALIRKQDRTEADINTVFWFNVVMSALMCAILCAIAPWLAGFYQIPELCLLTRVSAGMMFLNAITSVHYSLFLAKRNFKTSAIIGICTSLVSMPVTVYLAYTGWSFWSVLIGGVVSGVFGVILVWIVSPWKPRFMFSLRSFIEFMGFGGKLVGTGLIGILYDQSRIFIIGKFYSPAQLAFFSRATHLCEMPIALMGGIVGGVTFPILAAIQNDEARLIAVWRKYVRLNCMLVIWSMITLAANAPALIYCLYGENWVPCAVYVQVMCFGFMWNPLSYLNMNLWLVKGRSDLRLKSEIIMRCVGLPLIVIGACHSVFGICCATVLSGAWTLLVCLYFTKKAVHLSMRAQLADFMPYLIFAFIVNIPAFIMGQIGVNVWACWSVGGLISFVMYFALMQYSRNEGWELFLDILSGYPALKRVIDFVVRYLPKREIS